MSADRVAQAEERNELLRSELTRLAQLAGERASDLRSTRHRLAAVEADLNYNADAYQRMHALHAAADTRADRAEAERDRLQGEVERLTALREQDAVAAEDYGRLIVTREQERDEARAQLAERDRVISELSRDLDAQYDAWQPRTQASSAYREGWGAAAAAVRVAASRPSSPDTTEATG